MTNEMVDRSSGTTEEAGGPVVAEGGGEMRAFEPEDLDAAVAFRRAIADPTERAVLDFLIDHPEERFDGAAIVRRLGLAGHRAVGRATFGLGTVAAGLGRRRPWREGQLGYLMPAAQAELLRRARERVG